MFNQKKDEVLVKKPGDIGGLDFAIRYLEGCNVSLYDMCAQVSQAKIISLGNGRLMQELHNHGRGS
jgi:hypothetical protein